MIIFVVPAYNEEMNIARLIARLDAHLKKTDTSYRLMVVDDGSVDRTAEIVQDHSNRFPCQVIRYFPNQGVQEAFRRGFHEALASASPTDRIVTLEADGTADLEILKELMAKVEKNGGVAVASYYAKGGAVEGTTLHRKILSFGANCLTRLVFRIRGIHTYSSFYRVYSPEALRKVVQHYGDFFTERGFACVVELLVRIHHLGFSVSEVPMILRGAERVGKSKMKVFQTILGYLRISFRCVTLKSV